MAPDGFDRAGFESGVRHAPVGFSGEPIAADVPDALTRHNRNLSVNAPFLRPRMGKWQAASAFCHHCDVFSYGLARLVGAFKVELTVPA